MRENSRLDPCCPGTSPADFAWEKLQKPLHFVQRGRILLRCGSALALSLPSLGVSSLDLGRLFTQAALFLRSAIFCARLFYALLFRDTRFRVNRRRAIAHHGESLESYAVIPAWSFRPDRNDDRAWRHSILRRPGTVRDRQAERRPARRPTLRNPWSPGRTSRCVRAAARPCRSPG